MWEKCSNPNYTHCSNCNWKVHLGPKIPEGRQRVLYFSVQPCGAGHCPVPRSVALHLGSTSNGYSVSLDFTLLQVTAHIQPGAATALDRKCWTPCALHTELLCHRDDAKQTPHLLSLAKAGRFCRILLQTLPSPAWQLGWGKGQVLIAGTESSSYQVYMLCRRERQARIPGNQRGRRAVLVRPRVHWLPRSLYCFWLHRHVAMEPIHATATWPPANKTSALARALP